MISSNVRTVQRKLRTLIALARASEMRMLPELQEQCEYAVEGLLKQSGEPVHGLFTLLEAMDANQVRFVRGHTLFGVELFGRVMKCGERVTDSIDPGVDGVSANTSMRCGFFGMLLRSVAVLTVNLIGL